jgi:hypothetical protein
MKVDSGRIFGTAAGSGGLAIGTLVMGGLGRLRQNAKL